MKAISRDERTFSLARSEEVAPNIIAWVAIGASVVSICLLPQSFLPILAVAILLIIVVALTLPARGEMGWMAIAIALVPMIALVSAVTIGGRGGAIVVVMLAVLLIFAYRQPLSFALGFTEAAMVLFAIALVIGATHGGGPGILNATFHSLLPLFLSWMLGRTLARTSRTAETLWWTGIVFLLVNAPLGILEAASGTDLIAYPDTELVSIGTTGFVRPNGFNSTDIDFALSMTICVALVLGGNAPGNRNSLVIPIASLGSIAVILCSFRTGWIVLAAIWIFWLFSKGTRSWVLASAGLLAAIPILITPLHKAANSRYFQERVANQSNVEARSAVFGQAWHLFTSHPLFGVGLNAFQIDRLVLSSPGIVVTPHNLWLGVLAELGLVGAAALIAIAGSTFYMAWVLTRRGRQPLPSGARGAVWACAVLVPFSLTFHILEVPISAMLAGLFLGTVRGLFLVRENFRDE